MVSQVRLTGFHCSKCVPECTILLEIHIKVGSGS